MNCRCNSHNDLSIVQGDTLEITLSLENPEELIIERVTFVCKSLNINEDFTPSSSDDLWSLTINPNETEEFYIGNFAFDVTAVSDSGEVFTVVHNGNLRVLHKSNKDDA